MADTVSKQKRSEIMSHVTGKETKPEIMVRKYLFAHGLRYRQNVKQLHRVLQILYFRSIKRRCSLTAVFGMDIKGVNMLIYHLRIWNIGRRLQII